MWHKERLLQMCEREKLPKLKTNSKLIKFQEEINGVYRILKLQDIIFVECGVGTKNYETIFI
jgi:uncharacterized membrane protein